MSSTLNSKSLQPVLGTDNGALKLARSAYYKYRAANLMFGFNTGITLRLGSFCAAAAGLEPQTRAAPRLADHSRCGRVAHRRRRVQRAAQEPAARFL